MILEITWRETVKINLNGRVLLQYQSKLDGEVMNVLFKNEALAVQDIIS